MKSSARGRSSRKLAALLLSVIVSGGLAVRQSAADETVNLTVSKIKDLDLRIYGFVEQDVIHDSTIGQTEEQDNAVISKPTGFSGMHGRTIMTVKNSRLGFDLKVPKTDSGVATEAVLEMDFEGNNAPNTQPGSAPGSQSERDFFNNGAMRMRHAWVNVTTDHLGLRMGQYWSLLGWQPYYFPSEPIIQPAVGQLYRRFPQIRLTNQCNLGESWMYEGAVDAAKPAQMASGDPEYHAGLRLSSTKIKGATQPGSGTAMVGLSAAVSGAYIPLTTAIDRLNGSAAAFDVFVPIIPSSDGKDKSNNLSLTGECVTGSGIGGLELAGLTAGVAGITAASPGGQAIDSGLAGINTSGHPETIRFRSTRVDVHYILPGGTWALGAGYRSIRALNLDSFNTSAAANLALVPRMQYAYASLFWDSLSWLRFGGEYSRTIDTYNDPANTEVHNNRVQFTSYFVF